MLGVKASILEIERTSKGSMCEHFQHLHFNLDPNEKMGERISYGRLIVTHVNNSRRFHGSAANGNIWRLLTLKPKHRISFSRFMKILSYEKHS